MFGLSRLIALILAFTLGFSIAGGALFGGIAIALTNFRVRDLEKHKILDIPDELFMGTEFEVDLLNLTAFEFVDELKYMYSLGDDVTINMVESRYDLKIPSALNSLLSQETREMPLRNLLTKEGAIKILESVYIGNCQKYECHKIDSTEKGNPADGKELTRWYDPASGKYVTGINSTIAYFTLADFAGGGIHVDSVLDGIVLADVLGYSFVEDENGKKTWYDKNGQKITGVMSVFADCTLDNVDEKINTTSVGNLIGYEQVDGKWYQKSSETGELEEVHPFMGAVADSNIDNMGSLFDKLTIADLVPEKDRTGLFAILPPETELDSISSAVNDTMKVSPMQFFINQEIIAFDATQQSALDDICFLRGEITEINEENPDFDKYYNYEGHNFADDGAGNYLIPTWRTKPLNESFGYIVGLLLTPINP